MLKKHSNENIVLQAVMDEFEENREKGNLTAELLNREKVNIHIFLTAQKNASSTVAVILTELANSLQYTNRNQYISSVKISHEIMYDAH